MPRKTLNIIIFLVFLSVLVIPACAAPQPAPTNTPQPTSTIVPTSTKTPRPSPTPRPTRTPNLAATKRVEELNAEAKSYFDLGYLTTTDGRFAKLEDFTYDWAQLGWYNWLPLPNTASDFFMSGHFKWNSAYKSSDISGCGFLFDLQENDDHYAVFLDRAKVLLLMTDHALGFSKPISPTHGTGRVKFDYPAEADFTLIVKGTYAYVLVDKEVVGEYTLAKSRSMHGNLGLTVLSGTNKDYGTHCEMTNLHLWTPKD